MVAFVCDYPLCPDLVLWFYIVFWFFFFPPESEIEA